MKNDVEFKIDQSLNCFIYICQVPILRNDKEAKI